MWTSGGSFNGEEWGLVNGEGGAVRVGDDVMVRALQVQRWRTAVAIEVAPRLWDYFDEVGPIVAVVEDVVDRWISSGAGRVPLTGPDGFAVGYLAAVERDPAGRPWWQFCRLGAGRRPVVDESYPKRMWTYHAGWLQRIRPAGANVVVPDPLPGGVVGEVVVERLRTEAAAEVARPYASGWATMRTRSARWWRPWWPAGWPSPQIGGRGWR
jgi:hypothetical protein